MAPATESCISRLRKQVQASKGTDIGAVLESVESQGKDLEFGESRAPVWQMSQWIESMSTTDIIADALLQPLGGRSSDSHLELAFARAMATKGSYDLLLSLVEQSGLVESLAKRIWVGMEQMAQEVAADAMEYEGKFNGFQLAYGGLHRFHAGLEDLIGLPEPDLLDAMEREHCECPDSKSSFSTDNYEIKTCSEVEWWFVKDPVGGLKKLGIAEWPSEMAASLNRSYARTPTPLASFETTLATMNERLRSTGVADLTQEELIGLRLYTGPMFVKYNGTLRGLSSGIASMEKRYDELCNGNTYTTTLHVINSGLVKLGSLTNAGTVYRGVSGGKLPKQFLEADSYNARGGVETAFMSTTTDPSIARKYASAGRKVGKAGLIIEIKQGMIDRGADISSLSQYPHEREICFPPLCGLEVMDLKVNEAMVVATMRPNVNMKSLTIEKVIAKRQQAVLEMCDMERKDLARDMKRPAWNAFQTTIGADLHQALLTFATDLFRARSTELSEHNAAYYNRNDKFGSTITHMTDFASFIRTLPSGVESLLAHKVDFDSFTGNQTGSDAGSKARMNLAYFAPEDLPEGYLLLGHGYRREALVAARGPMVKQATGWAKVWTDAGSGNKKDYAVWLPTYQQDPEYVALGVVCTFGTAGVQEPQLAVGMVHKSCCKPAHLGNMLWKDSGTGAKNDITLNSVMWGDTEVNLMMPSVCTLMGKPPPIYAIQMDSFLRSLSAETLDLSSRGLGDAEVGVIAAMVRTATKNLRTLNLSKNHFSLDAGRALAYALSSDGCNKTITALDVSHNSLGEKAGAVFGDMLCANATLKTLVLCGNDLGRVGEQLVVDALKDNTTLEHLDLRGALVPVETVRKGGRIADLVGLSFIKGRQAGSDAGSKARMNLAYYVPENMPEGYLLMGHGSEPEALVTAKGPMVKQATGWAKVWTDAGSGNKKDYAVWLPTYQQDPEYVALGVVCTFGTAGVQEPQLAVGMVHKSCCKPAHLGNMLWNDSGTRARRDITLNSVMWDGTKVNLMMPSVCTLLDAPPPIFAINDE